MARKSRSDRAAERQAAAVAEAERLAGLLAAAPAGADGALAAPAFIHDPRLAPALVVWRELAPSLEASGRLGPNDRQMFAALCYWRAEWIAAVDDILANGYSFMARATAGGKRPWTNPAVERRDTAWQQMMALSARFGLTPLDRIALARGRIAGLLDGDEELPLPKPEARPGAAGADAEAPPAKKDGWTDLLGDADHARPN